MTATDQLIEPQVGPLLRGWRTLRRLSQLELANLAEVSPRHLSFLENGRSRPSRDMLLNLADQLDVPLRERNLLLLAAGYAPAFAETALTAPLMSAVRTAVSQVLVGHDPFPALVVDRDWNIVDANAGFSLFTDGVEPQLLRPPVNALRLTLHPGGMAPRIVNLPAWRSHVLNRLRRRLATQSWLRALYQELYGYPGGQQESTTGVPATGDISVPLTIRHDGQELSFFAVLATFGAPTDITVAELTIESFFPANKATAAVLHGDHARVS
jgi:transcriptional regulator with XRE-family HTH domain